jgi:hypothetical protein
VNSGGSRRIVNSRIIWIKRAVCGQTGQHRDHVFKRTGMKLNMTGKQNKKAERILKD